MSQKCCIPQCLSPPGSTLHTAPSKKYCSGKKQEWAEQLEKIILGLRADKHITDLYRRDMVKICSNHFMPNDIIRQKSQIRLRVGAIPVLKLPKKSGILQASNPYKRTFEKQKSTTSTIEMNSNNISVPVLIKSTRKPPMKRETLKRIYIERLNQITRAHKPTGWTSTLNDKVAILSFNDGFLQNKFNVFIHENLEVKITYYEWFVPISAPIIKKLNSFADESKKVRKFQYDSLFQLLKMIENSTICAGYLLQDEYHGDNLQIHVKNSKCDINNPSNYLPTVTKIADRSKKCLIFFKSEIEEQKSCPKCWGIVKNKIKFYRSKGVKVNEDSVLKKISGQSSVTKCPFKEKDEQIKALKKRVNKLLEIAKSQIELNDKLSKNFESPTQPQVRVVNADENLFYFNGQPQIQFIDELNRKGLDTLYPNLQFNDTFNVMQS